MAENDSLGGKWQNLENLKRRAFELCLAIYRVTKLFPQSEVLVRQIRETASDIVVALAQGKIHDAILKVEALKVYLNIAKDQNWAKSENFDLLQNAYGMLADAILWLEASAPGSEKTAAVSDATNPPPDKKNEGQEQKRSHPKKEVYGTTAKRQKQIMDYMAQNMEVTITDLKKQLGKVSDRTLRNDMSFLIDKGVIKKIGNNKSASYILKEQIGFK